MQCIANLHLRPFTTNLDTVCHPSQIRTRVTDRDIGIAVRWGAVNDGLLLRRHTIECISSHSLRAGRAMALKLSGALDSTIMRVGRWTSLTYLTYIHTQIDRRSVDGGCCKADEHRVHLPKCRITTRRHPVNRIKSVGLKTFTRLRASRYKMPGHDPAFAYGASLIPGI